jgi:hypothetical protein
MTLDVLHFIDAKGGNAEEIRESQRKRGLSVELVDEVISMYNEWVKSASGISHYLLQAMNALMQWTSKATTSTSRSMRFRRRLLLKRRFVASRAVLNLNLIFWSLGQRECG